MVSPWVEPGSVYNEEYRHTSLIATLRKMWDLGDAFTKRDESARTFEGVFTLDVPRDPATWASVEAQPVPQWTLDIVAAGGALSTLGKAIGPGLLDAAKKMGVPLPSQLDGPNAELTPTARSNSSGRSAGISFLASNPATPMCRTAHIARPARLSPPRVDRIRPALRTPVARSTSRR